MRSIMIERFRGIEEGSLEDLSPGLTVLVGSNGSGKSAILDALLIAASPNPADAIGRSIWRRQSSVRGARWLFWRLGQDGPAAISAKRDAGEIKITMSLDEAGSEDSIISAIIEGVHSGSPFRETTSISVDKKNHYKPLERDFRPPGSRFVRLIETRLGAIHTPLHAAYSKATEQGRAELAIDIVRKLTGANSLQILTDDDTPYLSLGFPDRELTHGRIVPVELAGDGIQAVIRLALELAMKPGGLALLEEPEVHLHPAALQLCAQAITEATRRGVQVVMSTHSLELIDALLAAVEPTVLTTTAVFRTRLEHGRLATSRLTGGEALNARTQIEEDLR